ncbi:alpha-L-fucosidase [Salegentibacter maritimus]|uniref:alpha-L-fucosidase n=1 Tax=Salegentibacter maritimus TaxID=2794347 RepID=UPI0018E40AFE|nr:alpha-L-fucosidase [Salegentibacter maritimus]MBI6117860.1 alpha-L-fucosidase [Salegentibacter maritimus]
MLLRTKRKELLFVLVFLSVSLKYVSAQEVYDPTWESLDSRPIPSWFEDAKFGIFIHWGPYSVPAFTPKGTYSEWYQYWLEEETLFGNGDFNGDEVTQYHRATYGDINYYEFGKMFKADLFQPKEWAELFENAGARYVILTAKHHDGYALWPSEEANDRGFPWNSSEIGPKKDLVGLLSDAVKNQGLKMGLYYSLYEWYHPWWQKDQKRFVREHLFPQIKDLVQKYEPDVLWSDGEWDLPAEEWKSKEFLAWLYNDSNVKNKIVVNDRWGEGIRKNHGGYFTTEYEAEDGSFSRPWEECRGMGFSFGYNQNEDAEDYNSAQALTLMLINIVSTGGNLLLDIGPDSRGNIPPIMQDRLLKIGQWLRTNGEAIYNTRPWNGSFQWGKGTKDYHPEQHYLGGDFILKQTINPEPGFAVKELFFTQNAENKYVLAPKWPGVQMKIKNVTFKPGTKITLLVTGQELNWQQIGKNVLVQMPNYDPNIIKPEEAYAYVFKIKEK